MVSYKDFEDNGKYDFRAMADNYPYLLEAFLKSELQPHVKKWIDPYKKEYPNMIVRIYTEDRESVLSVKLDRNSIIELVISTGSRITWFSVRLVDRAGNRYKSDRQAHFTDDVSLSKIVRYFRKELKEVLIDTPKWVEKKLSKANYIKSLMAGPDQFLLRRFCYSRKYGWEYGFFKGWINNIVESEVFSALRPYKKDFPQAILNSSERWGNAIEFAFLLQDEEDHVIVISICFPSKGSTIITAVLWQGERKVKGYSPSLQFSGNTVSLSKMKSYIRKATTSLARLASR